jgi:uncharacterized damage-inducible protein DinB
MATSATAAGTSARSAVPTGKQQFLETYDREHETTMRVLRAYPPDQLDLRPHKMCKTARELAWVFVAERSLFTAVFNNAFAAAGPPNMPTMPEPPESWKELLAAVDRAHKEFGELVRRTPEEQMSKPVKFFTAPKTMGDIPRMHLVWMMLHDEIHHRGQFSIYLRMAGAKVPSIYGPSADEPWM